MKFSIVIPAYNSEQFLPACLESLVAQTGPDFEVLIADDASTDQTVQIASAYASRLANLRVFPSKNNAGPGAARNAALDAATGDWVLFLDSDDELAAGALASLQEYLKTCGDASAVGFDWLALGSPEGLNGSTRVGRRDGQFLGDRERLIHQYLSHRMDGSVIYTAVRRDLLEQHHIRFAGGIHEDVDFIFKVYFHSPKTAYFNRVLYLKRQHPGSIIQGISQAHIDGYFRAWESIRTLVDAPHLVDYRRGITAAIATRVREVVRHATQPEDMSGLFESIHAHVRRLVQAGDFDVRTLDQTVYSQIASLFWHTMSSPGDAQHKAERIASGVRELAGKSWSCVDLHHSLFLRPDEVRTCCKRFFVGGEMRGDVILFGVGAQKDRPVSAGTILEAKRDLHQKINAGEASACDGCPFMEFREWSPLNELDIRYLSLEHHSLCNMRCTYCSDEYFGGKEPSYDVERTLEDLISGGQLARCSLVIWGGGEPVLPKDFERMFAAVSAGLPGAQQRVLTNATRHSSGVERLLAEGRAQVITSVDAGTDATFQAVRDHSGLKLVASTLRAYAKVNPAHVTVKYIFTDGNSSAEEASRFAEMMRDEGLLPCNFQISYDFKHETVDAETAFVMLQLFGSLRKFGSGPVYFDELLRHRLGQVLRFDDPDLVQRLHQTVGFDFIANPADYPRVAVWGAGQQAKYLLQQTVFFKKAQAAFFVDSTPEKIGTSFLGKQVKAPSSLRDGDLPVVIAAVQGYPLILEQFREMKLPDSRLVHKLIV